jgi:phosphate transport system substrate-binding protein
MNSAMEAIKNGQYPSPPARNLYLISNGKPDNEAVLAFLRYILTDGQKLVPEAGYVELNKNKIQDEKTKLNIPL